MSWRWGFSSALAAGSVIGVCMLVSPVPGHLGGWLLPGAVAGSSVTAILGALVARRAYWHACLHRELLSRARKATLSDIEIEELDGISGAFVAGLVTPHIFCSRNLGFDLGRNETRAVLLHERYHQLDRAPVKLIALDAVAPLLTWLRVGRGWLTHQIAALEIAADQYALAHGASRHALAGALIKLQPVGGAGRLGIGFATAADLRLRALIDEECETSSASSVWLGLPFAVGGVCLALIGVA